MHARELKAPKSWRHVVEKVQREYLARGEQTTPQPKPVEVAEIPEHALGKESDRSEASVADAGRENAGMSEPVRSWENRVNSLDGVFDMVRGKIGKEKDKQAKYHNRDKREFDFAIGSKVLKRNFVLSSKEKNFNAKLAPRFIGPFTIAEKVSSNVYLLEKDGERLKNSVHSKDLKPFRETKWHEKHDAPANPPKVKPPLQTENLPKRRRGRPPKTSLGDSPGAATRDASQLMARTPRGTADAVKESERYVKPRVYQTRAYTRSMFL